MIHVCFAIIENFVKKMISQNNVEQISDEQVPCRRSTLRNVPEERPSTKKMKETLKCFKSPLFAVQIIMWAIGNCTVSLSLNVVNDLIMRQTNDDDAEFEEIQTQFEIARAVISTMSCILMGFATDFSMKISLGSIYEDLSMKISLG